MYNYLKFVAGEPIATTIPMSFISHISRESFSTVPFVVAVQGTFPVLVALCCLPINNGPQNAVLVVIVHVKPILAKQFHNVKTHC